MSKYNLTSLLGKKELFEEVDPRRMANLLDEITSWPLYYVEIPDKMYDELEGFIMGAQEDDYSSEEVDQYLQTVLDRFINDLNDKHGIGPDNGKESGFFTILPYDVGTPADRLYSGDGDYEAYHFSQDQYDDVIEAGKLNEPPSQINEQEDVLEPEEVEFEPTWDEVWEVIEQDAIAVFDELGSDIDTYNAGTFELNSNKNGVSGHHLNDLVYLEDNFLFPSEKSEKEAEKKLKYLLDSNKEYAADIIEDEAPKVWAMFGGDIDLMDEDTLYDAEEAYREAGDEEMADQFQQAIEGFQMRLYDMTRDDDESMVYLHMDVDLDTDNLLPIVTIVSTLEGPYGNEYDGIKVDVPFESMEDLKESFPEKLKEVYDYMSGETHRQELQKKRSEEKQQLNEANIYKIEYNEFSKLLDKIIEEEYKYISLNPEAESRNTHSILLWLEDNFGEGKKAFTYKPLVDSEGKPYGAQIFMMPEEISYFIDDLGEADFEMLDGVTNLDEKKGITEDYEIKRRKLVDRLIEYILEEDLELHRVEGDEFNNLEYVASDYWNDEAEMFDDEAQDAIIDEFELIGIKHPGKISYLYTEEWIDMYPFISLLGEDLLLYYDAVSGVRYIEITPEEMQEIIEAADLSMESLQEVQEGWSEGVNFKSPASLADRLSDIGAGFYEFSDEDYAEMYARGFEDDSLEVAMKYLEEIGGKLDQYPIIYTFFKDGDGIVYFLFSDYSAVSIQDWEKDEIEMVIDAGEMGRLDEAWDDGIPWGDGVIDIYDAANRLSEMGAKFIEYDYDIDDVNHYSADTAFESIALMMEEEYSDDDTLYYAYEYFYDGNERKKAFVFSDGDYVDVTFWSDDDIEMLKDAGEMGRIDESWYNDVDWSEKNRLESLTDALVSLDAKYIPEKDIKDLPSKERYIRGGDEDGWVNDTAYELKLQAKRDNEDNLLYSIVRIGGEQAFISSDQFVYYLYMLDDYDIELIKSAGQLTEDVDLKDDRINQLFKAYSRDNFDAAAPDDGDPFPIVEDVNAKYYTLTAALSNDKFPVAIQEYAQDFWDGDWLNYTAKEKTRDEALDEESFESDFSVIKKQFYGMEDEIDAELLRDAGYDEQAEEWEKEFHQQKAALMDDDFQVTLYTDVEVANHRGKQQLYQIVNFYIQEEDKGGQTLLDVKYETHTPLDEIESVEDLKKLLDDFHAVIEEDFQPCKRPVVVTQYDYGDYKGTQIN